MTTAEGDRPDVREQLIRGALGLIAAEGPVDLSVRRLAQAADRTTMCIYTKFTSRTGLLAAVYDRAATTLLAGLDAVEQSGVDAAAEAYWRAAEQDPGVYALLFAHSLEALGLDAAARASLVDSVADRLARSLLADGHRADLAGSTARALWATLHGLAVLRRLRPEAEPARGWVEHGLDVVRRVVAVG